MAYYVSAIKRQHKALVLGPFRTHGEALAHKHVAKREAGRLFKDVDAFDTAWGTAHDRTQHSPGVLNPHIVLELDAEGYVLGVKQ